MLPPEMYGVCFCDMITKFMHKSQPEVTLVTVVLYSGSLIAINIPKL